MDKNEITQWFEMEVENRKWSQQIVKDKLFKCGWSVENFYKELAKVGQKSDARIQNSQGEWVLLSSTIFIHELATAISDVLNMEKEIVYRKIQAYLRD